MTAPDLDAIKKRVMVATRGAGGHIHTVLYEDIPALVAEVERLRKALLKIERFDPSEWSHPVATIKGIVRNTLSPGADR